jgi:hypothetical protein
MVGWSDKRLLGNNVPLITAGIVASILAGVFALRCRSRGRKGVASSPWLSNFSLLVLCTFTIPAVVVMFFGAGKSSLMPPAAGISIQNWGCCTHGLVFQQSRVKGLVKALQANADGPPADVIVRDYARNQSLTRWALNPVMIQPIGLDGGAGDNLWSMEFENLDPKRLKRDHSKMISKLYPASEGRDLLE